jgi:hypothetical protein
VAEASQGGQQRHDPGLAEAQPRAVVALIDGGPGHLQEGGHVGGGMRGCGFGVTETPVEGSRRLEGFNDLVLILVAKGMTMRDVCAHLGDVYGVEVSPELISKTDSVWVELIEWQNRPLDECYPVLFVDALTVKVRDAGRVVKKPAYLGVGLDVAGRKHILGVWLGNGGEGASFWLSVFTELRNRGVNDVLIACGGGPTGAGRRRAPRRTTRAPTAPRPPAAAAQCSTSDGVGSELDPSRRVDDDRGSNLAGGARLTEGVRSLHARIKQLSNLAAVKPCRERRRRHLVVGIDDDDSRIGRNIGASSHDHMVPTRRTQAPCRHRPTYWHP